MRQEREAEKEIYIYKERGKLGKDASDHLDDDVVIELYAASSSAGQREYLLGVHTRLASPADVD